jgi:hypothetical protein
MNNNQNLNNNSAGKGCRPRNCFSKKYRDNYDSINWNKKQNNNEKNEININVAPPPKRGLSTFR